MLESGGEEGRKGEKEGEREKGKEVKREEEREGGREVIGCLLHKPQPGTEIAIKVGALDPMQANTLTTENRLGPKYHKFCLKRVFRLRRAFDITNNLMLNTGWGKCRIIAVL